MAATEQLVRPARTSTQGKVRDFTADRSHSINITYGKMKNNFLKRVKGALILV